MKLKLFSLLGELLVILCCTCMVLQDSDLTERLHLIQQRFSYSKGADKTSERPKTHCQQISLVLLSSEDVKELVVNASGYN